MNRNNLLYQAAARRQQGFKLNPDFAAAVMKRVSRRQRIRSAIGVAAAIVAVLAAIGVGVYYLWPSIRDVKITAGPEIIMAIIPCALCCLLLLADLLLRRKFLTDFND